MNNSVDFDYEDDDDDILFPCDDIVSTSLENKSIVFNEIEHVMSRNSLCLIEMGNKSLYNKVIKELMIYCLHKKYIHSIYKSVLSQLISDWRNRQYVKFYKSLIS